MPGTDWTKEDSAVVLEITDQNFEDEVPKSGIPREQQNEEIT